MHVDSSDRSPVTPSVLEAEVHLVAVGLQLGVTAVASSAPMQAQALSHETAAMFRHLTAAQPSLDCISQQEVLHGLGTSAIPGSALKNVLCCSALALLQLDQCPPSPRLPTSQFCMINPPSKLRGQQSDQLFKCARYRQKLRMPVASHLPCKSLRTSGDSQGNMEAGSLRTMQSFSRSCRLAGGIQSMSSACVRNS